MSYRLDDTIIAVASPRGGAARGILRISGPGVHACVAAVFQPAGAIDPASVQRPTAFSGSLLLGDQRPCLPCELFLWPTRRSFTGAPAAEIHTLGSPPLLDIALAAFASAGARPAEPGEFTLRAFLNGRVDLTQAEAVLGVVDAGNSAEFDAALSQLAGGLATPLGRLRDRLLDLLAHLEAGFDFADEDLPLIDARELREHLAAASRIVADLVRRMDSRHAVADLVRVVLVGWPNTGKSSLFNALAGRAGALVCSSPATTRDYLTAEIELSGLRFLLIDTAGIEIEPSGADAAIRRAAQAASQQQSRTADLEVFCLDSTRPQNAWERSQLAAALPRRLVVLTKIDLGRKTDFAATAIRTSSVTGEGLDALREQLRESVLTARVSTGEVVAATAVRCRDSLRRAADSLRRARRIAVTGSGEELVAAELRAALEQLGLVVGAVCTDDILDRVFSRFCIGK